MKNQLSPSKSGGKEEYRKNCKQYLNNDQWSFVKEAHRKQERRTERIQKIFNLFFGPRSVCVQIAESTICIILLFFIAFQLLDRTIVNAGTVEIVETIEVGTATPSIFGGIKKFAKKSILKPIHVLITTITSWLILLANISKILSVICMVLALLSVASWHFTVGIKFALVSVLLTLPSLWF